MGFELRTVLPNVCAYWRCPWYEVERNLFRVEIDEGTVAANVFEGSGVLHLGLIAFEDDIVAQYSNWRSLTPGSYYLHRLLEYLRGLSTVGETTVPGSFAAPSPKEVLRSTPQLGKNTPEFINAIEILIPVLVFRFTIRLIGIDPAIEFISIPIETRHMKILPDSSLTERPTNAHAGIFSVLIEKAFESSLVALREFIDRLVTEYASLHKQETDRALRQIRSARDAELQQHESGRVRRNAAAVREEIEELWREREEAILARSNVERVETALVAVTIQWRTIVSFQYRLYLAGSPREIEILFDRSSGWLEPFRCESCGQSGDVLEPAKTRCHHLICAVCRSRLYDCGHSSCNRCDVPCIVCTQLCCSSCSLLCFDCAQCICKRHARSCFECNVALCGRCSAPCAQCKKLGCEAHSLICPVCTEAFCVKHFQHDESCYQTWVVERTAALLAFGEFDEPFCIEDWFVPFTLTGADSFAIEEKTLSVFPEAEFCDSTNFLPGGSVVVSLDDQLSWLVSEKLFADPIAQEYGLLPDEFFSLGGWDENRIIEWTDLLFEPFAPDLASDSTRELVPSYDSDALVDEDPPLNSVAHEYGLLSSEFFSLDETPIIDSRDLLFGSFVHDLASDPTRELVPMCDSDAPEDEYPPLADSQATPDKELESQELQNAIFSALRTLTPREEMVIKLSFGLTGDKKTLAEIAKDFQLSLQQVTEIEAKALRKLRHPSRSRRLGIFIDLLTVMGTRLD